MSTCVVMPTIQILKCTVVLTLIICSHVLSKPDPSDLFNWVKISLLGYQLEFEPWIISSSIVPALI